MGSARPSSASPASFLADSHAPGATLLGAEEREGLLHPHVRTHGELNALEEANILHAEQWITTWQRKRSVLTERFLITLHKEMFGMTWSWAGQYRQTMNNISPYSAHEVPILMRELLANVQEQHHQHVKRVREAKAAKTPMTPRAIHDALDDIAARYHHQLVLIHPWPNGNGRHARMAADLALRSWDRPRFSWGANQQMPAPTLRAAYVDALRQADGHDYAALRVFVRS